MLHYNLFILLKGSSDFFEIKEALIKTLENFNFIITFIISENKSNWNQLKHLGAQAKRFWFTIIASRLARNHFEIVLLLSIINSMALAKFMAAISPDRLIVELHVARAWPKSRRNRNEKNQIALRVFVWVQLCRGRVGDSYK